MKKSIIIIGILLLTVFICKAQDKESFKLKANWKKGEVKEMIVQHSGSWIMNGEENTFPKEISAKYLITIVDKTEKGYIVEWKILNDDKDLEEVYYMKNYISHFKYTIETYLNGNFKELSNWESLIELNKELKENIISEAKKENVSQQELDNLIMQMKLAETKDELIEMCNGLTDIFHGSYGEELLLNDTISEHTTIPNQHLKNGIPAILETITKKLNDDIISIKYAYVYDYEKLMKLHEKHFPDQEYEETKMNSYSEFLYNNKTGWIEKIIFYNEVETGLSKNTTIIEHDIK